VCAACGNGTCDSPHEDSCNCAEDCGAPSCSTNSNCPTGQVCFHGISGNKCTPASEMCTSLDPNFNRCVCPGCTCSGNSDPGGFWGCVV
jgi:hypothetical protein